MVRCDIRRGSQFSFFFLNDPATTEIYTLPLHDALPISGRAKIQPAGRSRAAASIRDRMGPAARSCWRSDRDRPHLLQREPSIDDDRKPHWRHAKRSEEHTSELQSRSDLVCRLLLEKKKK